MNVLENASSEKMLKFKVACKSNELSDEEIFSLFMGFTVESEAEIKEICDIIQEFRPILFQKLNNLVKK